VRTTFRQQTPTGPPKLSPATTTATLGPAGGGPIIPKNILGGKTYILCQLRGIPPSPIPVHGYKGAVSVRADEARPAPVVARRRLNPAPNGTQVSLTARPGCPFVRALLHRYNLNPAANGLMSTACTATARQSELAHANPLGFGELAQPCRPCGHSCQASKHTFL